MRVVLSTRKSADDAAYLSVQREKTTGFKRLDQEAEIEKQHGGGPSSSALGRDPATSTQVLEELISTRLCVNKVT